MRYAIEYRRNTGNHTNVVVKTTYVTRELDSFKAIHNFEKMHGNRLTVITAEQKPMKNVMVAIRERQDARRKQQRQDADDRQRIADRQKRKPLAEFIENTATEIAKNICPHCGK